LCQPYLSSSALHHFVYGCYVTFLRHPLYDHHQLPVLFPEYGKVGFDDIEEFVYDRNHPFKVPRTLDAVQYRRHARKTDLQLRRLWIHFLLRWMEDEVHTVFLADFEIPFKISWICLQIFIRTELKRIDKQAERNEIGLLPGFCHQRHMPFMKISHRRDESNFPFSVRLQDFTGFFYSVCSFHHFSNTLFL